MPAANQAHDLSDDIRVFSILKDATLKQRLFELNSNFFNIVELNSMAEATDMCNRNDIIIIEDTLYNDEIQCTNSVLVITDDMLNLKDDAVNFVPKELYLTKYLDEFIFWAIEKIKHIAKTNRKFRKKKDVEQIIKDLQTVSRASIFVNK